MFDFWNAMGASAAIGKISNLSETERLALQFAMMGEHKSSNDEQRLASKQEACDMENAGNAKSPMLAINHNNVTITLIEYNRNKEYPCPSDCVYYIGECIYKSNIEQDITSRRNLCAVEITFHVANASDSTFDACHLRWKMIDSNGFVYDGSYLCDRFIPRRIGNGSDLLPHTQANAIVIFPELEENVDIASFVCTGTNPPFKFDVGDLSETAKKILEKPPTAESKSEDKYKAYSRSESYQRLQNALQQHSTSYTDGQYNTIFENLARNYYSFIGNEKNVWDDGKILLEHYPYIVSISEVVDKNAAQKNIFVVLTRNSEAVKDILSGHGIDFKAVDAVINKNNVSFITFISVYNNTQEMREVGLDNMGRVILHEIENDCGIKCGYYTITWSDSDRFAGRLSGMCELGMSQRVRESNSGIREDLGMMFRSSWEANIARILNVKGIAWEYEKETIALSDIGYLPDFFLPNDTIMEVKGCWDADSLKKVLAFHKERPDKRLLIADADVYFDLYRKYSKMIPNWEDDTPAALSANTILVVGLSFVKDQSVFTSLTDGSEVCFVRKPDNQYDTNAILVTTIDGKPIGHISADWATVYAPKMDIGMKYRGEVISKQPKVIKVKIMRQNADDEVLYDIFR